MNYVMDCGIPTYVTTTGTAVLGSVSGQSQTLFGVLVGACSAPLVTIYTNQTATTTAAFVTCAPNAFTRMPLVSPTGFAYNVTGSAAPALTFVWMPGPRT